MSQPPERRTAPTMRDVAREAGVSKALVSIVFRGVPGASEETRARVFDVAERLGYRTNRTASLLKLHRTRHLGVTMTVRNAFHGELVEGIQEAADEAGYEIVLSVVTDSHDEDRAVQTLQEFRCESLILLGSQLGQPELSRLAGLVPVVLVGRRTTAARTPEGLDVVRTADDRGLGLVVDHLAGLGHSRIFHIDGGHGVIAADRRRGYRTAMRRHGLESQVQVVAGGRGEREGWAAAEELLTGAGEAGLPTAVTAFNDHCALGVIARLVRAGVRVPEEVSVTGYDDSPVARYAAVDLTTVNQEPAAQARWAVRAAVDRLEGLVAEPRQLVLQPSLVIRGTSGPERATTR